MDLLNQDLFRKETSSFGVSFFSFFYFIIFRTGYPNNEICVFSLSVVSSDGILKKTDEVMGLIKEMTLAQEFMHKIEQHPQWDYVSTQMKASQMDHELDDMDDFDRAQMLATSLDLAFIGNGSNRFVVEYEGMAIKMPLWSMGFHENGQEAAIWANSSASARSFLLPCLDSNETIAVYPLIETIPYMDWASVVTDYEPYYLELVQELNACGIQLDDTGFYEERYDQWAFYEGRLVLIDYGACFTE